MDSTLIGAIISGVATLLATLLAVYLTPVVMARKYRTRHAVPDILGTWKAKWYIDGELYEDDVIEIPEWHRKNHFLGHGRSSKGAYTVFGQIDSSRIAVGTYEDDEYPTKGLIGTFVLELSVDARTFTGFWNGRTAAGAVQTGRTEWSRAG